LFTGYGTKKNEIHVWPMVQNVATELGPSPPNATKTNESVLNDPPPGVTSGVSLDEVASSALKDKARTLENGSSNLGFSTPEVSPIHTRWFKVFTTII